MNFVVYRRSEFSRGENSAIVSARQERSDARANTTTDKTSTSSQSESKLKLSQVQGALLINREDREGMLCSRTGHMADKGGRWCRQASMPLPPGRRGLATAHAHTTVTVRNWGHRGACIVFCTSWNLSLWCSFTQ